MSADVVVLHNVVQMVVGDVVRVYPVNQFVNQLVVQLVDRLVAMLYAMAGQGDRTPYTKVEIARALDCAQSPTFRAAMAWAVQSGLVQVTDGYQCGRLKKFYILTTGAIEQALTDEEMAQNANALPF